MKLKEWCKENNRMNFYDSIIRIARQPIDKEDVLYGQNVNVVLLCDSCNNEFESLINDWILKRNKPRCIPCIRNDIQKMQEKRFKKFDVDTKINQIPNIEAGLQKLREGETTDIDFLNEHQHTKFVFEFLNVHNKSSYIILHHISKHPTYKQIDEDLYSVTYFLKEDYEDIAFLWFCLNKLNQWWSMQPKSLNPEFLKFNAYQEQYQTYLKTRKLICTGGLESENYIHYKKIIDSYKTDFWKEYNEKYSIIRNNIYDILLDAGKIQIKWISEYQLYCLVKKTYKDALFQHHTNWLGLQSLDIFIPSLMIAIEYQGQQHYEPVEIFGGLESFLRCKERDEKKKQLCEENGVKLLYWKYTIDISEENLRNLLEQNI